MKVSAVYEILNTESNSRYVGSSVDVSKRFRQHIRALNSGTHHSYKLQKAWKKHGHEKFLFSILEVVPPEVLTAREQSYIDRLEALSENGYNIAPTAGSCLGMVRGQETRDKVSRAVRAEWKNPGSRMACSNRSPAARARQARITQDRWANQNQQQRKEALDKLTKTSFGRRIPVRWVHESGASFFGSVAELQRHSTARKLTASALRGVRLGFAKSHLGWRLST